MQILIGEEKTNETRERSERNAAAVGVLLGALAGAGIHASVFPLGGAGVLLLGALGGLVLRYGLYPLFARD